MSSNAFVSFQTGIPATLDSDVRVVNRTLTML